MHKVLVGGSISERGVGPLIVVEELVVVESWGDGGDGEGSVVEAPELGSGGAVGALDAAVELGPARRQHMQRHAELLFVIKGDNGEYRAEDFVSGKWIVRRNIIEDGWLNKAASPVNRDLLSAYYEPRSLPAGFDEAHDIRSMIGVNHRAHFRSGVEGVAWLCA